MRITGTNLFALGELFGASETVENRMPRSRARHIKRCIAAGLCVVEGNTLRLTEGGKVALRTEPIWVRRFGDRPPLSGVPFRKGDTVKYKSPQSDYERNARFVVLDDPAEQIAAAGSNRPATGIGSEYRAKVDMQEICDLPFRPVRRAPIDEIEKA